MPAEPQQQIGARLVKEYRIADKDVFATASVGIAFAGTGALGLEALSRGAAESFINTAALLHPRGYLQVQDIFVTSIKDYAQGFRGPGKLDGSFVTWVNGAFLHAVGARAGYHVNFAAFPYRAGSKTQILYTTRRD